MKFKLLLIFSFVANSCFAQLKLDFISFDFLKAKSNQIIVLNERVDSLNTVINNERDNHNQLKYELDSSVETLNQELLEIKKILKNFQDSIEDLNKTLQEKLNPAINSTIKDGFIDTMPADKWSEMDVFKENWSTTNLFPYVYSKNNKIPNSLNIRLFEQDTGFAIPFKGNVFSGFGMRRGRMHKGLDIKLQRHDTVKACMSGIVRFANYNSGGFGNIIIIRHLNGLETYYAHLQKMVVKPNDIVHAGDFIGTGGTTGTKRTGPHLHFECRWKDYPLDPRLFIDYTNFELKSDTLLINPKVLRAKPTPTRKKYYTIKSGDTLYGLAIRYNTSVSRLCQLNGLRKTSTLRINQRIRIK